MKKLIVVALVTFAALLAGCKEEPKTAVWYRAHPDEAGRVYAACLKSGEASLNCEGAKNAVRYLAGASKDPEVKKRMEEYFPPQPIPTFK